MKKPALLEFELGLDDKILAMRTVTREAFEPLRADGFPPASPQFKQWLDWMEPGEAFKARTGFLYLCIELTTEE